MMTNVEILKQLKAQYDKNNVSALIGAGFSKNAISGFPQWGELLQDAVAEMLSERYGELKAKYSAEHGWDDDKCSAEATNALLGEYGNLEFVSRYLQYKGIGHEAIDAYIEERIKPIQKCGIEWKCGNTVISKDDLIVHQALLSCVRFRNIYTTNYDNLLEHTRDRFGIDSFHQTITAETDLSDSASKQAIVKLHGTLPERDDKYEFDGDHNLRYIIAGEDYQSYMTKHQGFSYLMRIAMLQSRFCLIGFSGTDPNYMLWLQWMKDVLDKAQQNSKDGDEEKRVYLILVEKEEIEPARQLFYKNHHVGVINISEPECVGYMREMLHEATIPVDIRGYLLLFFRYLSINTEQEEDAQDSGLSTNYAALWGKMHAAIADKQNINTLLNRIRSSRAQMSCVSSATWQQYTVLELLHKPKEEWNKDWVQAFILAARDMGVMPGYLQNCTVYDTLLLEQPIWQKMLLNERVCLNQPVRFSKDDKIFQVYSEAYNLNFDGMYSRLKRLTKNDRENTRFFFLSSLVDREDAATQMLKWLQNRNKISILSYNEKCTYNVIVKRPTPPISTLAYHNKGYQSDFELIREEASGYKQRKEEIKPYGLVTRTIQFASGDEDLERAMRVLNMLIETGYTPSYNRRLFIDKDVWMNVFGQLFESYPYPMLYYSATYSDDKLLRRIGQEFAYSETLYPVLPDMLMKALQAIGQSHTPFFIKEGLDWICSELYVSVPDTLWYVAYRDNVLLPYLKEDLSKLMERGSAYCNVYSGLEYIREPELVIKTFLELSSHFGSNPMLVSRLMCDCLQIKYLDIEDVRVLQTITTMICSYDLKDIYYIAYVLAVFDKLPDDMLAHINQLIANESLEFAKDNPNAIVALANLANNETTITRVKQELVMLGNIWDCGIRKDNGRRSESGTRYIDLNYFPKEWSWTDDEVRKIFANMIDNATMLETSTMEDNLFKTQYVVLVSMMMHFYYQHKEIMPELAAPDFEKAMQNVLRHVADVNDRFQMLTSEDDQVLRIGHWGVLAGVNQDRTYEKESDNIMILFSRAMSPKDPCWVTIAHSIRELLSVNPQLFVSKYRAQLVYMLKVGWNVDYGAINARLPMVFYHMIELAKSLLQNGVDEPIVHQWIEDKMRNRFVL